MLSKMLGKLTFGLMACFLLSACTPSVDSGTESDIQANVFSGAGSATRQEDPIRQMEKELSELNREINRPNVLKEDILRGWYLAAEHEKKYGTPDNWIFIEDGDKSRWVSPLRLEEVEVMDDRTLCRTTAGTYQLSCADSSESGCEYEAAKSHCACSYGSRWRDGEGCILTSDKGAYVAINQEELDRGWYFGLPSQKKLNTPSDWVWEEAGKKSIWKKP